MSRALRIACVGALSLFLAGCEDWGEWGDSSKYKEDFQHSYTLKSGGKLSLETMNGAVEVTGWDQDKVEVTATKYASSEGLLNALKIDVVSTPDSLRIRTIPPSGYRGGMGARYTLHVPRQTDIERIVSSNGKIQIQDVDSAARLKTSNGSVRVDRTKGNLEVETSNASVELTDHAGPAVVHTSNGAVRAEQVKGYFEATTSNASITARVTEPEPGRPIKLESSNGSITIAFDALRSNDIRATTSNSSITVRLPASIGAQVRARTSNSSITTDFDVNMRGSISKNSIEGTIGSGGANIELATSNGSIRIQKI